MLIYDDLLKAVAKEKHTFISTGMSNYEDIDKAVKIFRDNDCPFELMHCVSTYPMPEEIANLKLISTLKNRYSVTLVTVAMKLEFLYHVQQLRLE